MRKIDGKNQLSSKWYYKKVLDICENDPLWQNALIGQIFGFCRMDSQG